MLVKRSPAQRMPRMAKLFPNLVARCCLAASCYLVAASTLAWAAPAKSEADPLRTPPMLKRIFAQADAKPPADPKAPDDILKLGLSKRDSSQPTKASSPVMAVATSAAALIFVIAIFLLIAWFMKRGASRGMRTLPTEAFEVLGRSSLNAQQSVQLVRVGNKLLLVASSADGASTLTEIDDAQEVERLSGLCMTGKNTSATKEFHEAFEELAAGPATSSQHEAPEPSTMLNLSAPPRDRLTLSDASLLAPTN
jgi:flagellar biogenesis protein FliO